ncbi:MULTISPECIES: methyltransferase domain-containing protein [Parafrankia]|uniref:methyltransferase domain-containing protein n=1 Tax=Parafrankia TaxID=2994362 RepID=UPI0034D517D2
MTAPSTPSMPVGAKLAVANGAWNFDGPVMAAGFVDHVRRSVPFYDAGHGLAAELASTFVRPGGLGYEFGTSTGQLLRTLATSAERNRAASWIGVERVPEMVESARRHCAGLGNVSVVKADLTDFELRPCDFAVAYLTLNFLDEKPRADVLARVRQSLREGGGLFVFEKVLTPDPHLAAIIDLLHLRFKRANGLSPEEILNKADSLAGILQPATAEEYVDLMRAAGFRRVTSVMRYLCFEGFLAQ